MTHHQTSLNQTVNLMTLHYQFLITSYTSYFNIIQNLHKSKATGPDQVHKRLLIVASSMIAEPPTTSYNIILHNHNQDLFLAIPQ